VPPLENNTSVKTSLPFHTALLPYAGPNSGHHQHQDMVNILFLLLVLLLLLLPTHLWLITLKKIKYICAENFKHVQANMNKQINWCRSPNRAYCGSFCSGEFKGWCSMHNSFPLTREGKNKIQNQELHFRVWLSL
jgi:hypothetical protein